MRVYVFCVRHLSLSGTVSLSAATQERRSRDILQGLLITTKHYTMPIDVSPDTHIFTRTVNPSLPILERKMYRCIKRVLERGGLGNRFVSIHNKDFPGNNSGGVTVGEAKVEAVMRRYMSVNNKYNPGAFSKGYRVTKKGFDSYMANTTKKLKKESLEEPQGYPNATLEEAIIGKSLQALELSSEFTKGWRVRSQYDIENFYRAYRLAKEGKVRFTTDEQGRIYHCLTNLKKDYRKYLSFDGHGGEPLAEVDIKTSNPVMLLKGGFVHPEEKELWATWIHQGVFYEKLTSQNTHRNSAKRYINAVFNGSDGKARAHIAQYFPLTIKGINKSTGLELMKMESTVMNKALAMFKDNFSVVRLHDAILCSPNYAPLVAGYFNYIGLPTNYLKCSLEALMEPIGL